MLSFFHSSFPPFSSSFSPIRGYRCCLGPTGVPNSGNQVIKAPYLRHHRFERDSESCTPAYFINSLYHASSWCLSSPSLTLPVVSPRKLYQFTTKAFALSQGLTPVTTHWFSFCQLFKLSSIEYTFSYPQTGDIFLSVGDILEYVLGFGVKKTWASNIESATNQLCAVGQVAKYLRALDYFLDNI